MFLEILGRTNTQEKILCGKEEVIFYLFADDITLQKILDSPPETCLINNFSKVAGYKSKYRNDVFLSTKSKISENEIKLFIVGSKVIQSSDIHLTKGVKDLYIKNYKSLI